MSGLGSLRSWARARTSARSRSTPSYAPLSPAGLTNAPTGPADTPVLFLNQRGGRLSVKGAHDIITKVATAAGLEDHDITAHVFRHTFATRLVRGRTDLVIVAELLGHARLETTRAYSRPTHQDASTRSSSSTSTTDARC
jgi:integrase